MDTYFFIIVKLEEEPYYTFEEGEQFRSTLMGRYPDREFCLGGAGTLIEDGYAVAEVCACHMMDHPTENRQIPAWDVDFLWAH